MIRYKSVNVSYTLNYIQSITDLYAYSILAFYGFLTKNVSNPLLYNGKQKEADCPHPRPV